MKNKTVIKKTPHAQIVLIITILSLFVIFFLTNTVFLA